MTSYTILAKSIKKRYTIKPRKILEYESKFKNDSAAHECLHNFRISLFSKSFC